MKRSTRQRTEIMEALGRSGAFVTAQELHARLREEGSTTGLTTVYRNLQSLAAEGTVDTIAGPHGEAMFRRCASPHHHHHLVCTNCRTSVEVEAAALEDWARRTADDHGFTIVDHVAELFGLCSRCSAS